MAHICINYYINSSRLQRKKMCNVRALQKCPQKRGTIIKPRIAKPKKPNSAQRKIAKVKLSTGRCVLARIKGQGHSLKAYSTVLVSGGRANDLPGVRFSLIRGKFDFSWRETFDRVYKRSKYGIPRVKSTLYTL